MHSRQKQTKYFKAPNKQIKSNTIKTNKTNPQRHKGITKQIKYQANPQRHTTSKQTKLSKTQNQTQKKNQRQTNKHATLKDTPKQTQTINQNENTQTKNKQKQIQTNHTSFICSDKL